MGLLEATVLDKFESFVGVNFWTMIFAWANLLILYIAFKKFLFVPIKKMIDDRQHEIDDMYTDAESARESAGELKAEYEEKISHANEESEEILKEANAEASRVLERAEEQIELEKKRALNDVKDQVSSMAIGIASAVIERDVSEDEHRELIDDFINNIGNE